MNDQYPELSLYIQTHLEQGTELAVIRQRLVQAGWTPKLVDSVLRHALNPSPAVSVPPVSSQCLRVKPVATARVLYVLGILGLIMGLFIASSLFAGDARGTTKLLTAIPGFSILPPQVEGIVFACMVVALFVLISFTRSMRRWALITYTCSIALLFVSALMLYLTRNDFDKLIGMKNPSLIVITTLIVSPVLVLLWTRNRADFR